MSQTASGLLQSLESGLYRAALTRLYGADAQEKATARAKHVIESFLHQYGDNPGAGLFSGPGRTEIGGNHTDHQHGRVLCGSVNLDILACAAPNGDNVIRVLSEGYPAVEIALDSLEARKEEENTSAALVRGIAAKLQEMGYSLSGFDAYCVSDVLSGSGLSSSAAYEILVGNILNHFSCEDKLDAVTIAKVGQFAENVYFGKPCGLMDQMGSSIGGAVAIDFRDPANPVILPVDYDFSASGHALCIVDTGSCHADLTSDYADIPREMGAVAAFFGKQVLRDVDPAQLWDNLPAVREAVGDRAVLRAMHFFQDDPRAWEEAQDLQAGDFSAFLQCINASGLSSELLLQNIWSPHAPEGQAVSLSLTIGKKLLGGTGAIRVHGGGFAGTIQAFVPVEKLESFRKGMEAVLGEGKCHVLQIRPVGGCLVAE